MPKPLVAQIKKLQDSLTAIEEKIAPLKAERDAHIKKNRAVYETERKYADKIKALQADVGPIWEELKEIRTLIAGKR